MTFDFRFSAPSCRANYRCGNVLGNYCLCPTPAIPACCFWVCVNDSACFAGPVDVKVCATDGKNFSGSNAATGISATATYDPATDVWTVGYSCSGGGHSHTFPAGSALPLSYSDPSGWSLALGSQPACGNQACVACGNASWGDLAAVEFEVYLSANFVSQNAGCATPNNFGDYSTMMCNAGTCHFANTVCGQDCVSPYGGGSGNCPGHPVTDNCFSRPPVTVAGLNGAYYCTYQQACQYGTTKANTSGCCGGLAVIATLAFGGGPGNYSCQFTLFNQVGGAGYHAYWNLQQSQPFDCMNLNKLSLPWVSNSAGWCDASSVTCEVTSL